MAQILHDCSTSRASSHGPSLFHRISTAFGVWRQRRTLSQLDAHILKDIGVTDIEALQEANRPFWDAPASWRR